MRHMRFHPIVASIRRPSGAQAGLLPCLCPDMAGGAVCDGERIGSGQSGADDACLRTAFNGFGRAAMVDVNDRPLQETPGNGPAERAA